MNRYSRQPALTDVVKCGNSAQCSAAKQKLRQLQLFYEFAEHNRRRWRRCPNASTSQSLSPSQSTSLPASGTSFCKESVNLMSSSGSGKPHFWGTHCTLCVVCAACGMCGNCNKLQQQKTENELQTSTNCKWRRPAASLDSTRSSHHNFSQGTTGISLSS